MIFAAYADQAGDTFGESCEVLASLGIKNLFIRSFNAQPILDCSDEDCKEILRTIGEHKLNILGFVSDVGNRHPMYVRLDGEKLSRSILLAKYFGAQYLRIWPGKLARNLHRDWPKLHSFLAECLDKVAAAGLQAILEPTYGSFMCQKSMRSMVYEHLPIAKYLYDPVALALGQRLDIVEYWREISVNVAVVELRDVIHDQGLVPVGHGDMQWSKILPEIAPGSVLVLDPGLGYRYKGRVGKSETFKYAFEQCRSFLSEVKSAS